MVIEPDTCTDLAWVIALLAARTICSGDLAATPLPELPPQAASAIALTPAPRRPVPGPPAGPSPAHRRSVPGPPAGPSPAHRRSPPAGHRRFPAPGPPPVR